jgi:hypothetical protein
MPDMVIGVGYEDSEIDEAEPETASSNGRYDTSFLGVDLDYGEPDTEEEAAQDAPAASTDATAVDTSSIGAESNEAEVKAETVAEAEPEPVVQEETTASASDMPHATTEEATEAPTRETMHDSDGAEEVIGTSAEDPTRFRGRVFELGPTEEKTKGSLLEGVAAAVVAIVEAWQEAAPDKDTSKTPDAASVAKLETETKTAADELPVVVAKETPLPPAADTIPDAVETPKDNGSDGGKETPIIETPDAAALNTGPEVSEVAPAAAANDLAGQSNTSPDTGGANVGDLANGHGSGEDVSGAQEGASADIRDLTASVAAADGAEAAGSEVAVATEVPSGTPLPPGAAALQGIEITDMPGTADVVSAPAGPIAEVPAESSPVEAVASTLTDGGPNQASQPSQVDQLQPAPVVGVETAPNNIAPPMPVSSSAEGVPPSPQAPPQAPFNPKLFAQNPSPPPAAAALPPDRRRALSGAMAEFKEPLMRRILSGLGTVAGGVGTIAGSVVTAPIRVFGTSIDSKRGVKKEEGTLMTYNITVHRNGEEDTVRVWAPTPGLAKLMARFRFTLSR